MHNKITRIAAVAAVALAIGGGIAASAGAAGASSTVVTATTQVSNHPDTTSGGTGTACTSSNGGPVWALDTYLSTLTAVATGTADQWRVTVSDNGTFAGFADPANCNAMVSKGSFVMLYTVAVSSTHTPSQSTLKASYTTQSTTQMVQDFFGDPSASVSGGDYFASYQNGAYVQTGGCPPNVAASGNPPACPGDMYGDVSAYVAPPPTLVKIPYVKGLSANAALAAIRAAGFSAYTSPLRNPKYTYVATGTSPSGSAPKGSTVIVYVKQT